MILASMILAGGGTLSLGMVFWIIMLLALVFGLWSNRTPEGFNYGPLGGHFIFWLLMFIIGWSEFGFPIGGR